MGKVGRVDKEKGKITGSSQKRMAKSKWCQVKVWWEQWGNKAERSVGWQNEYIKEVIFPMTGLP